MSTTLKGTIGGGTTFSASPAIAKPQVFISKFGDGPWFSNEWFDKDKIIKIDESVSEQATVTCEGVTNMRYMFSGVDLHSLDLSNFDTSNVTDMGDMFEACTSLQYLDLSSFDTSNVTNMCNMFDSTDLLSLDLSNFDTSNVKDMSWMFNGSRFNELDLSSFDTSKVEDMSFMFNSCSNLTTIKGVIDMKSCTINYGFMFYNCKALSGVKIKNPPDDFDGAGLSSSQYTIVS